MITVVDYHKGNLMSVERALRAEGAQVEVTDDARAIARAQAVVLPGVGAFADAAQEMGRLGQREAILEALDRGAAFLGICLGLHLMFEEGEEGAEPGEALPHGLGLLPGTVRRLPREDAQGHPFKLPHVGWSQVEPPQGSQWPSSALPLLGAVEPGEHFYFTHSYVAPEGPSTAGVTTHSVAFPSVAQASPRAFGVQFHPEKSSAAGGRLLAAFVRIAKES